MSKDRLSKSELRDDEFFHILMNIKDYYAKNQKTINIAFTAIVVVIVGTFFIRWQMNARSAEVTNALGNVEMSYYQNNHEQLIQLGKQFMEDYGDTKEASLCSFFIGNSYYAQKDYANASSYYQKSIDLSTEKDLYFSAAYEGVANCLMQEKKYQEAAEKYIEASKAGEDLYAKPFVLNKAADAYRLANMNDEAAKIYEEIINNYPDFPQLSQVKIYYNQLTL